MLWTIWITILPAKCNLGNGEGFTNLQVLRMVEKVSGQEIPFEYGNRRPGDPAVLIASSELAKKELEWQPQFPDLESIVRSAWQWHSAHPEGYGWLDDCDCDVGHLSLPSFGCHWWSLGCHSGGILFNFCTKQTKYL